MLGFGAFIAASFVLGVRLLRLWRRTGQIPEGAMGLSFLLGGGLGYSAWFAYAVLRAGGAEPAEIRAVAVAGLGLSCLGALTNAVGIRAAFRPGDRRATALLAGLGLLMLFGWGDTLRNASAQDRWPFWLAMGAAGAAYLWTTGECLRLHVVLRRRARFGLAAPHLAERALLCTVAFGAVVVMVASSLVARGVLGANVVPPAWVSTGQSLCGLVCAAAIWLGFFPPAFYRRRRLSLHRPTAEAA